MAKISDRYYTGRDVQRVLGITEPALRNLVNQKKLRKIIPPGKQTGVYLKEEVDTYAEKWFAFLTAEEPPKTTFEKANREDMEAVYELSKRAIGPTMNAQTRQAWLSKNPESCYVVKHKEKIVAFFHFIPIVHQTLMKFMNGEIRGWDIKAEDVEAFHPGKDLECLAIIASEPDVDNDTRRHYVTILIRGIMRELHKLGTQGVIITKVYATSQTPTGIAMAMHGEMQEFGARLGKRLTFVLDMQNTQSFLANSYQKGLALWKKEQQNR